MKKSAMMMFMTAAVLGCGGAETTTGTGGAGGETTAANGGGGQGGEGGCTDPHDASCIHYDPVGGAGGGTGGTGGAGGEEPLVYTVDPPWEVSVDGVLDAFGEGLACAPFSRLSNEDGSWTRVVMTTPGKVITKLRWIAARGTGFGVPATWTISVSNLAPGLDPAFADCGPGASAKTFEEIDSFDLVGPGGDGVEFVVLEATFDNVTLSSDGSHDIVCLKNYVDTGDGTPTAIVGCGAPAAGSDDRDQWQDNEALGGGIHGMCSYGPNYCVAWMVTTL